MIKEIKLSIDINRSVEEVWNYTLDSNNTPKWFLSIKEEKASSNQVCLGTQLKNCGEDMKNWSSYEITEFVEYKTFTLSSLDTDYHVKYTFTPTNDGCTFEYYEWCYHNELSDPTTIKTLELLKSNLESK